MSTKAQLQAMKFSGLSETEQWRLLNLPVPLADLVMAGQAKQEFIVAHAGGKVLPAREPSAETPKVTPLQPKKPGGELGEDTPLPVATPRPGPTPQATPISGIKQYPTLNNGLVAPQAIRTLSAALATIDTAALSSDGKKSLTLAKKKLASGEISSDEQRVLTYTFLQLKAEAEKSHFLSAITLSSQPSATWDITIINNQEDYSDLPGSFGVFGSIKKNGCGFIAIHNLNQILGDHSQFLNDYYKLNGQTNNYYELNGQTVETTLAGGLLGMDPRIVRKYYEDKDYHVTLYSNQETFEKHDGYIMLYAYAGENNPAEPNPPIPSLFPLGAHYIAIEYDDQTGNYTAYNNNRKGKTETFDSFSKFYREMQYSVASGGSIKKIKARCMRHIENSLLYVDY